MNKKFATVAENEVCISGTVLATHNELLRWTDKSTGLEKSGVRFSVIIQGDYGIVFARAFNPSDDLKGLKAGDSVFLPIDKYEKENGMKIASLIRGL